MKRLIHFMGDEWNLRPAGGATGEAYIAQQGEHKIFIKRNSSPFLAVLSAEGIVPKLLWTRRLENGDVITAQKWVSGRELKSPEMSQNRVAKLLSKIHQSEELLHMFMRMGNHPLSPHTLYDELRGKIGEMDIKDPYVMEGIQWLKKHIEGIDVGVKVVCHADVNHNNWIISEDNLYLIDWDGAIVADPALDLAPLLYLYIPKNKWENWLYEYGLNLNVNLQKRLRWYMVAQCVEAILWHWQRQEFHDISRWTDLLSQLFNETEFHLS
ncbi:aminoglycoside phosphotransferase [Evansella cellulosilytica DSM 2522]|uniref:Aminoglycoside phosphotransferase n=1 Tax=Evansella cellulosilytica (strain ATCC 21833 / DSM 2522 / FERM P-1141 / JCM 9156 / N-4) TaxID=649639 RepID=E6U193_EVAC2|nr:aminoglycoside phosphotransferase [Evansella cellulosilytica DSM 2522]